MSHEHGKWNENLVKGHLDEAIRPKHQVLDRGRVAASAVKIFTWGER